MGVASVSYRSSSQIFIQRERSATYRPISEFRFAVSFINKLLATIIDDEALQGDMKKNYNNIYSSAAEMLSTFSTFITF